jgi:hypothetical protein
MSHDQPTVKQRPEHALGEHLKVVPPTPADPDEVLLASLRLDPAQSDAVVRIPITLQARKPSKQEFIRVHPEFALPVAAIELKDDSDGGLYLVAQSMMASLADEARSYALRPYINRVGTLRLWPIRLPDPDGKVNEWHRSAAVAAARAMTHWVRVSANRDVGGYECFEAVNQGAEPVFPPDLTLPAMLRLAFTDRGRVIESVDHPLVKQLFGRL